MQVANRYGEDRYEKGWFKAIFLVLAWLMIFSLLRDAWQVRVGFNRITDSKQRLETEERRNVELKTKYGLVRTQEYREKLIREKLNMQKEGEVLAVLPGKVDKTALISERPPKLDEERNWQKWLAILY